MRRATWSISTWRTKRGMSPSCKAGRLTTSAGRKLPASGTKPQKCYLFGPLLNTVSANVLSTVFYDKYLQLMDHETVDFWQAFNSPMDIKAKPVYTDVDGTVTEAAEAITIENVLGVIFDEEAAGVTQIDEWTAASPFNPRAAYVTQWWHMNLRYWNDFTEKCVVLLLDSAPTADAGGDA